MGSTTLSPADHLGSHAQRRPHRPPLRISHLVSHTAVAAVSTSLSGYTRHERRTDRGSREHLQRVAVGQQLVHRRNAKSYHISVRGEVCPVTGKTRRTRRYALEVRAPALARGPSGQGRTHANCHTAFQAGRQRFGWRVGVSSLSRCRCCRNNFVGTCNRPRRPVGDNWCNSSELPHRCPRAGGRGREEAA